MTELRRNAPAICPNCGKAFACEPDGACWCMAEAFRLPLPDPAAVGVGCLCPTCLREHAAKQAGASPTA